MLGGVTLYILTIAMYSLDTVAFFLLGGNKHIGIAEAMIFIRNNGTGAKLGANVKGGMWLCMCESDCCRWMSAEM